MKNTFVDNNDKQNIQEQQQDEDDSFVDTQKPPSTTQFPCKCSSQPTKYYQITSSLAQHTDNAYNHEQSPHDNIEVTSNAESHDPEPDMNLNKAQSDKDDGMVEDLEPSPSQTEGDSESQPPTIQTQGEVEVYDDEDVMIMVPKLIMEGIDE